MKKCTRENFSVSKLSKLLVCSLFTLTLLHFYTFTLSARAEDLTRTIENNGVPWWDDSIVTPDRKDFRDRMWWDTDEPANQARDWGYWTRGNDYSTGPNAATTISGDESTMFYNGFWDPNVDYDAFEWRGLDEINRDYYGTGFQLAEDAHAVTGLSRNQSLQVLTNHDADTEAQIAALLQADGRVGASRVGKKEFQLIKDGSSAGKPQFSALQLKFPGCPFETVGDCTIWTRKPHMIETVANKPKKIPAENMDVLINLLHSGVTVPPDAIDAAPLLRRYRMLMAASRGCCTDGMTYRLRGAGASDGLIYKFVVDDANFYGFGDRCLMTSDADLTNSFANTTTAGVVADVRNTCLCKGREWFTSLLAPFQQVYDAVPTFRDQPFNYTYTDGLQRKVDVSINRDVQTVMNQIAACP
ncbi:MAG: hypothetical protein FWC51_00725 [Proteobacteria bacterium]|nr:hypothetical protein [Pseudomonadota bacterium]